jgi:hypothetical protein
LVSVFSSLLFETLAAAVAVTIPCAPPPPNNLSPKKLHILYPLFLLYLSIKVYLKKEQSWKCISFSFWYSTQTTSSSFNSQSESPNLNSNISLQYQVKGNIFLTSSSDCNAYIRPQRQPMTIVRNWKCNDNNKVSDIKRWKSNQICFGSVNFYFYLSCFYCIFIRLNFLLITSICLDMRKYIFEALSLCWICMYTNFFIFLQMLLPVDFRSHKNFEKIIYFFIRK